MPNITSSITIEGNNSTISGNNEVRIFLIASGSTAVTINNVTLKNGLGTLGNPDLATDHRGSAIYQAIGSGALTISNSRLIDNHMPAGCSTNSTGGAISAFGSSLTVLDSEFRGNTAKDDSAIFASTFTTVTIRRSSFTGHKLTANTTSCAAETFVIAINKTSEISNVTVSGNSMSGIELAVGTTTIRHSTIVGNKDASADLEDPTRRFGGGLRQLETTSQFSGRANLYNNIIANNSPYDCSGTIAASTWILAKANNLIKDETCNPTYSGDPKLASFRGAPGYHPLWQGSPAIDAADATECGNLPLVSGQRVDIRGVARPAGACDLGAYEGFLVPESGGGGGNSAASTGEQLLTTGFRVWAQYGLHSGIQFQRREIGAVGIQSLMDRGVLDVVDVWGYADQDWEVCFPQAGALVFLDAALSPRVAEAVAAYREDGYTCIAKDRAGMVVLMPGSSPTLAAPQSAAQRAPVRRPRACKTAWCGRTTSSTYARRRAAKSSPWFPTTSR